MKTLLRIDCSLRLVGSHSRALADFFEKQWKESNPKGKVIYRDLTREQLPHLQNRTVQAFHIPSEDLTTENKDALSLSNQLITELKSANELLISSPLYNLSVPSNLKAYFDHVTRAGHTFQVNDDGNYQGLLNINAVYIITTKGETYKGTVMESLDFQEPYLKTICVFLGMDVKKILSLEGTSHIEVLEKNRNKIHKEIQSLF